MTQVFISYTQKDAGCANHIRQELEAKGYASWHEPKSLPKESALYSRAVDNAILSSAAAVLVWSSSAAQSNWVERHILIAQRLKKPLFPVVLDGTGLPNTLVVNTIITSQPPCRNVVAQLLPHLPPPNSTDPLIVLSEKAAHELIRIRKQAIDQAADMLKRDECREDLLAILEYLARDDLITDVREKAKEVLDADAKKAQLPSTNPDDSRHFFGVKCENCGHVTYFDKRYVCSAYKEVPRIIRQSAGQELDDLRLKCDHCRREMVARVDCRGYK